MKSGETVKCPTCGSVDGVALWQHPILAPIRISGWHSFERPTKYGNAGCHTDGCQPCSDPVHSKSAVCSECGGERGKPNLMHGSFGPPQKPCHNCAPCDSAFHSAPEVKPQPQAEDGAMEVALEAQRVGVQDGWFDVAAVASLIREYAEKVAERSVKSMGSIAIQSAIEQREISDSLRAKLQVAREGLIEARQEMLERMPSDHHAFIGLDGALAATDPDAPIPKTEKGGDA